MLTCVASAQTSLSAAQEARAQAIGRTIRCPVCQGLPITESPSDLSQQMMRDLRGQVAAGRSSAQITDYFAARYGDTVLLDPPRRGVNLLLWLGPLLAFVVGGGWLLGYLRRSRRAAVLPEAAAADAKPETDTEPETDEYLEQVRAEVQGSRRGPA
ncbi:cytochrome c-type biogenesis protein [Deinococcus ruber]|uniref:cytochrome c-type biogenesis protein n=1 Tax=Deinococcus ruber TaxID=1848197 RepID=UPI00227D905A|nr:cytochrome c-type biogenesis protein [Deinococcus ruber]